MNEADIFIEKFHNLDGALLKEKKKSLFLLLENYKLFENNEEFLKAINEKLEPKSYLEEIYKFETLLYFKRSNELFDILKNGNDVFSSKIIKQPWFLRSIFHDLKPKDFVQNIFPQLSISIRSKLLKQILKEFKDEQLINSLFDELLITYGLNPALILLSGCSVEKIKDILKDNCLKLSDAKLKLLHDKDPSLIIFCYDNYYKNGGDMRLLYAFTDYLSREDANLYIEIYLKYKQYFTHRILGYRTTKKYVTQKKKNVVEEPQKLLNLGILNTDALVKVLGKDFPEFLEKLFPKEVSTLNSTNVQRLLEYYPKKIRYSTYANIFEKVYKKNLFEAKDFMPHKFLEVIPDHEVREKWVEIFGDSVEFIQYKRSSLAIPELKEHLIRCDDIELRGDYLGYLVNTCRISKDYEGFLEVLKFFCKRLRNIDSKNIITFLDKIYEKLETNNFNEDHWKYIYEIILILDTRVSPLYPHSTALLLEYCRFLYKSGNSFEKTIPIFLRADYQLNCLMFKNENFRDENFEKQFLQLFLKHYARVKVDKIIHWKDIDIVEKLSKWNKRHPNDKILMSEYDDFIEVLKKTLEDVTWDYIRNLISYLICEENLSDIFADTYFKMDHDITNWSVNRFFLKYQPKEFEERIEDLPKIFQRKRTYYLLRFLRKYEHIGVPQNLAEKLLKQVEDPEQEDKQKFAELLAIIMPKKDYLKLLDQYAPTYDKLNLVEATQEERNLYQIQMALAKSATFANCQIDALPIILKYCRGDFFPPALYSLYSCFNRVPEETLKSVLEYIRTQPSVSVRKHSIFLTAMAFPIEANKDLGSKMINDKNESIQKHLFTSSYKYFLKNPLPDFWNILQLYMDHLNIHDKESLKLITKIHAVPGKYKDQFTKKAWNVLCKLSSSKKTLFTFFRDLMNNIEDSDIKFLSDNLCLEIVRSKLFVDEDNKANKVCIDFATKFIMYSDDMRKNIQNVLNFIQEYNSIEANAKKAIIFTFAKTVTSKAMNKKELRTHLRPEFARIFAEEWRKVFTFDDTFEEHIMLDLMILRYENQEDILILAKKISELFSNAIDLYGESIIPIFKDSLKDYIKFFFGRDNHFLKMIQLLAEILKINSSKPFCLLIIEFIPWKEENEEFMKNYNFVMEIIENHEKIVKVYMNSHYKRNNFYYYND